MTIARGDLPLTVDPPLHGVWEGTIAITDDGSQYIDAAACTSLDGQTLAGPVIGYRVFNKSTAGSAVVARIRHVAEWEPADTETAGTDIVYAQGAVALPLRGKGTRIDGFSIAGFATDAPDAARAAVDVHVRVWFRGVD